MLSQVVLPRWEGVAPIAVASRHDFLAIVHADGAITAADVWGRSHCVQFNVTDVLRYTNTPSGGAAGGGNGPRIVAVGAADIALWYDEGADALWCTAAVAVATANGRRLLLIASLPVHGRVGGAARGEVHDLQFDVAALSLAPSANLVALRRGGDGGNAVGVVAVDPRGRGRPESALRGAPTYHTVQPPHRLMGPAARCVWCGWAGPVLHSVYATTDAAVVEAVDFADVDVPERLKPTRVALGASAATVHAVGVHELGQLVVLCAGSELLLIMRDSSDDSHVARMVLPCAATGVHFGITIILVEHGLHAAPSVVDLTTLQRAETHIAPAVRSTFGIPSAAGLMMRPYGDAVLSVAWQRLGASNTRLAIAETGVATAHPLTCLQLDDGIADGAISAALALILCCTATSAPTAALHRALAAFSSAARKAGGVTARVVGILAGAGPALVEAIGAREVEALLGAAVAPAMCRANAVQAVALLDVAGLSGGASEVAVRAAEFSYRHAGLAPNYSALCHAAWARSHAAHVR